MNELDKLRPEVAAAVRTMSGEAGGNRDDAYDVIEAELLRLARENETLIAKCAVLMSLRKRHRARAERAESELAALKRRIADAPVVECTPSDAPGIIQIVPRELLRWPNKACSGRLLLGDGGSV